MTGRRSSVLLRYGNYGDVNNASWGVVGGMSEENLKPDDLVVFFCAKPRLQSPSVVDYHYVGVGTVKATLPRRTYGPTVT